MTRLRKIRLVPLDPRPQQVPIISSQPMVLPAPVEPVQTAQVVQPTQVQRVALLYGEWELVIMRVYVVACLVVVCLALLVLYGVVR